MAFPIDSRIAPDVDPALVGASVAPVVPRGESFPEKALSTAQKIIELLAGIYRLLAKQNGLTTVLRYGRVTLAVNVAHTFEVDMDFDRWVIWSDPTAAATDTISLRLGETASPTDLTVRAGKRVTLPAAQRKLSVLNSGANSITVQCVAVSGQDFDVETLY